MVSSLTDAPVHHFLSFDGQELAYRDVGHGRPLVLIHGFFSTAQVNWIRYGHAALLVEKGYRVILPDLRGHGDSSKSHDPAAYPADVLADDGFSLITHLGLTDYDLGGYSLGGRTTVRMLARGAQPRRAIVSGMGLEGILHTAGRGSHFRHILSHLGTFERGTPEWMAETFLNSVGGDPEALLLVLNSFLDTPRERLRTIDMPVLVLTGEQDDDNGSAEDLAMALPDGRYISIPGNHMSAVTKPEMGAAIAAFLDAA